MKRVSFIIIIVSLLISGCVSTVENTPEEKVKSTPTSIEGKLEYMQKQIDELNARLDRVDRLKPSDKKLIPNVPFKIEIPSADWQSPTTYHFKENGDVEIKNQGYLDLSKYEISSDTAKYVLYPDNNSIKISSQKYNYYGLVLYDDYIASIYENGWINWVYRYKIIPPKYNSDTGKYELK